MATATDKIEALIGREEWAKARRLLERERAKNPDSHWVLARLGLMYYEQRRYAEALRLDLEALAIKPDCPLVLWNVAGDLDMLGKPAAAKRIYAWLLECDTSPADDPCWESRAWAESLKTDCLYRLGGCFERLGKPRAAERCFRRYLDAQLLGIAGTYSVDDVTNRIKRLHAVGPANGAANGFRETVASALRESGIPLRKSRRPPKIDARKLLAGP